MRDFDEPGGGTGFFVQGPEGHVFRFLAEKSARTVATRPRQADAGDARRAQRPGPGGVHALRVDVLGFKLSDRTGFMNFVRCDRVHHAIAYAQAGDSLLNHIAFEMTDIDAVMRGIGRLKDAGFETFWGPGRHGPGNNVFAYFVAPFGAAIEYTAEVQRVGPSYKVGGPQDWKWPPKRNDHWGISARNHPGGSEFRFRPLAV